LSHAWDWRRKLATRRWWRFIASGRCRYELLRFVDLVVAETIEKVFVQRVCGLLNILHGNAKCICIKYITAGSEVEFWFDDLGVAGLRRMD
jgi:hypothetical protein